MVENVVSPKNISLIQEVEDTNIHAATIEPFHPISLEDVINPENLQQAIASNPPSDTPSVDANSKSTLPMEEPVPVTETKSFEQGVIEGREAALKEAELRIAQEIKQVKEQYAEEITQAQTQLLSEIATALHKIEAQLQHIETLKEAIPTLTYAICEKILNQTPQEWIFTSLNLLIPQITQRMDASKHITIKVHPEMAEALTSQLPEKLNQLSIDIIASDKCAVAKCEINWKEGGAIIDKSKLQQEILQLIKDFT